MRLHNEHPTTTHLKNINHQIWY